MRVLVLGAGAVVHEYYLPAFAWLGKGWRVAVADLSQTALSRVRDRAPWAEIRETGFEQALERSDDFDFVIIALPNWLHVPACKLALGAGLPVLCEKPLALTEAECIELAMQSEQSGTPLEVAMVRRLTAANQAAAKLIQSGVLGQILKVDVMHGSKYSWTSDSGAFFRKENGGILADLGIHQLDWLISVLGPLEPVSYSDDSVGGLEASCEYELASSTATRVKLQLTHRRDLSNQTTICGDKAKVIIDRGNFKSVRICGLAEGTTIEVGCETPFDDASLPHTFESCFIQQLKSFKEVVLRSKAPRVTAADASQATKLIEWAYQHRKASPSVFVTPDVAQDRPRIENGSAVITGATGFIGGHLLERLVHIGFDSIKVPLRNFRTCVNAARFSCQLVPTELSDRSKVRDLVSGARWVFHLAYGQSDNEAKKITVDATKILVEEAVMAKAEAVVILSTMGVFGHPKTNELVDESFGYDPAYGSYGKSKAQMEQWLLSPDREYADTRVIVLNPTCVYGPEGKTYTRLPFDLAQESSFAWIENGSGVANYVYVENLVDAILLCAGNPAANRQRFLVNDGYCSWKEFLTPFLGELASMIPSFTSLELIEQRSNGNHLSTSDFVRMMLNNPSLRQAASKHRVLGPTKALISTMGNRFFPRGRVQALTQRQDLSTSMIQPAEWLHELFGPMTARFSSGKLQKLGWNTRVSLPSGQNQTVNWLSSAVHGFKAG